MCQETWSSPEQNYYYTLCLLTLQFVIPLTVLIFTYTKIAIAVWGKRPPGEAENSRDRRMEKSKRKVSENRRTVGRCLCSCLCLLCMIYMFYVNRNWHTLYANRGLWYIVHTRFIAQRVFIRFCTKSLQRLRHQPTQLALFWIAYKRR